MKRVLFFFLATLTAMSMTAQQYSQIKVTYQYNYRTTHNGPIQSDLMGLAIGNRYSKFYSITAEEKRSLRDSIQQAGGSIQDYLKVQDSRYQEPSVTYTVFKDFTDGEMQVYDKVGRDRFRTEETLGNISWEISNRDTVIAGFHCQHATASCYGRQWRVWFTPDIAVSEGPWKLHGLPGLILAAEDATHSFSFMLQKTQNDTTEVLEITNYERYRKCTPKQLWQMQKSKIETPMQFIKGMLPPGKTLDLGETATEILSKKQQACMIETYE